MLPRLPLPPARLAMLLSPPLLLARLVTVLMAELPAGVLATLVTALMAELPAGLLATLARVLVLMPVLPKMPLMPLVPLAMLVRAGLGLVWRSLRGDPAPRTA